MGTVFIARTSENQIVEIELNSRITNRALEPHYTCPAGKKAIFTGYFNCTSVGSGSSASFRDPDNLFGIVTWVNTATSTASFTSRLVGVPAFIELELTAGQEIRSAQSAGTNAEMEAIGKIKELPG
jgi:hypothetical protein